MTHREGERREEGVRRGAGGGRPPQQFGLDRLEHVHRGPPTGQGRTALKGDKSAWTGRGPLLDRGAGPPGLPCSLAYRLRHIGRPPR